MISRALFRKAYDTVRKYGFPEMPGLWGNSKQHARRIVKLEDLLTGETLLFGSKMTYVDIPPSLKNFPIDLTNIKPSERRDILRTAVRLNRIDNASLKNLLK